MLVYIGVLSMYIYVVVKLGDVMENIMFVVNCCFIIFMVVDCEGNLVNVFVYVFEDEWYM